MTIRVYRYAPETRTGPRWSQAKPLRLPHCSVCRTCLGEKTSLRVHYCPDCRRTLNSARRKQRRHRARCPTVP